jgi:hypothetical protein
MLRCVVHGERIVLETGGLLCPDCGLYLGADGQPGADLWSEDGYIEIPLERMQFQRNWHIDWPAVYDRESRFRKLILQGAM